MWGYDFTVDSFDPEIEYPPNKKERAHVFPWALGGRNAHGPDDSPKYYTLDAFRQPNGGPLPLAHRISPSNLVRESRSRIHRPTRLTSRGAEFDTLAAFLAAQKPLSPFSRTTLLIGQL
ncbi:hypothetical protein EDB92DRAFT_760562 [Lactarius akahatsu]|uniref:Uncharacterized protein n=1 Tax=Lactarius akahatsu TaxID=416441 RepID=A0AAD4QDB4_9AGAM|nr:hypothetical protein EDB92DRAFT_760562 [Lactarius akahatsu]